MDNFTECFEWCEKALRSVQKLTRCCPQPPAPIPSNNCWTLQLLTVWQLRFSLHALTFYSKIISLRAWWWVRLGIRQPVLRSYLCRENPGHAKALYRRAVNYAILGDYEAATADFDLAKAVDPSIVPEVDREVSRMKQKQKHGAQKEREQFKNFYSRKWGCLCGTWLNGTWLNANWVCELNWIALNFKLVKAWFQLPD